MKLAAWRRKEGMTQSQMADALGCSQSYVSQMERATDPMIPGAAIMLELYAMTGGLVQPNDFYDLPVIAARRKAA